MMKLVIRKSDHAGTFNCSVCGAPMNIERGKLEIYEQASRARVCFECADLTAPTRSYVAEALENDMLQRREN